MRGVISRFLDGLAAVCLAAASFGLSAQTWPDKPIRVIFPYQAGGMGDPLFRLLMPGMEQKIGQKFLFETRPGAGGNIGTEQVVRAAPDGYTLLMGATNNFTINQFLYPTLGFDPQKALVPISLLAHVPSVFYTPSSVPARTLQEFIAWARQNPGKVNYGSPGTGTTPHLNVELIAQLADLRLVHVPYKGVVPALQATLTNEVQLYLAGLGPGRGHLAAGKLRAIAVGGARRLPGIPEVPTLDESGFKNMIASNWLGMAAPAGTPAAIVERLAEAIRHALSLPDVQQRITELGLEPGGNTPREFARQIAEEARLWEEVIRKAGIKLE